MGWEGIEAEGAADLGHALVHIEEAEAVTGGSGGKVKAAAIITDAKLDGAIGSGKRDENFGGATVLDGVGESFLKDAEEGNGQGLGKRIEISLVIEADVNGMPAGHPAAETLNGEQETEAQVGIIELVRSVANIERETLSIALEARELGGERG